MAETPIHGGPIERRTDANRDRKQTSEELADPGVKSGLRLGTVVAASWQGLPSEPGSGECGKC